MAAHLQQSDSSIFDETSNGHSILLLEDRVDGPKTFSEYPGTYDLQMALINMYEVYRGKVGFEANMRSFNDWMDGFSRLQVFVFDKILGRYHEVSREMIKNEFEENNDCKEMPKIKNSSKHNGHSSSKHNGHGAKNLDRNELDAELENISLSVAQKRTVAITNASSTSDRDDSDEDWDM